MNCNSSLQCCSIHFTMNILVVFTEGRAVPCKNALKLNVLSMSYAYYLLEQN